MSDPRDREPAAATPADVIAIAARAHERDRYLSALLAPRAARSDLIALAAFAGEVARIPAYVSEPTIGMIRLQWWRDALDTAHRGGETGHPIADAIGAARERHRLPPDLLLGVIDAHEIGLAETPLADDLALLAHLDRTDGALFAAAARILGAGGADSAAAVAAAGRAYGLARMLIEVPVLLAQGRTLLPQSRLAAAGTSVADLGAAGHTAGLAPQLAALGAISRRHLAETRAGLDGSRALIAALLPCALVGPYLEVVERGGGGRSAAISDIAPIGRVWRLWRAHRRGRI